MNDRIAAEERQLAEARARGTGATLKTFARLSGPGWLQSAITLGGGSLASALYLGVLSGYHLLWLQVAAMLLGVVMLSAIAYVTLSTGERPFQAIRDHVNPVLAWGWILAVLLANLVWALPQFSLGTAAIQQNLLPSLAGQGGKFAACSAMLALATVVVWSYGSGARGVRVFEWILKGMVALIVLCFFGVVVALATAEQGLPWGEVVAGFVPDLSLISRPVPAFDPVLAGTGSFAGWWTDRIVGKQQDVMIAAAATAVGINMTFLLPYSMLRKGWTRDYRGLAIFDLATGLVVPFALATGCVVIASASQFHTRADDALLTDPVFAAGKAAFLANVDARLHAELGEGESYEELSVDPKRRGDWGEADFEARVASALGRLPEADLKLSAMLLERDASSLANALEPISGRAVSQIVFGIGVLGMAISTVIILMLISGFTFCEMLDRPTSGLTFRLGALAAGLTGFLGPFVWTGRARFWLAVPTSNFGMVLLPIAYWTFFLMMNSQRLLGRHMPRGRGRVAWNSLMLLAASVATYASLATVARKDPTGWVGFAGLGAFLLAAGVVHLRARSGRE